MRTAACLALLTLIFPSTAGVRPEQAQAQARVMEVYDPQPGPFIIPVDKDGRVPSEHYGIIANAVTMWSGEYLQAFLICFHAPGADVDSSIITRALTTVAAELRKRGGLVVERPVGGATRRRHDRPT